MTNRHDGDKNKNVINSDPKTVKEVFYGKKFLGIRLLIIGTSLITLLTWISNSLSVSCLLSIFQNAFMVFIITTMVLSRLNILSLNQRVKKGIMVGSVVGAIFATVLYLTENIQYYFLGGRELAFTEIGKPVPPLNFYTIRAELFSGMWACVLLVMLSAITGFISGAISGKVSISKDLEK